MGLVSTVSDLALIAVAANFVSFAQEGISRHWQGRVRGRQEFDGHRSSPSWARRYIAVTSLALILEKDLEGREE